MADDGAPNLLESRIAILNELSAAMRHQSQAEYVYSAAAVGGFGAVCLGVAALPNTAPTETIGLVALLIALLGILIAEAIRHNHETYRKIITARCEVASALAKLPGSEPIVPKPWTEQVAAPGVFRSYAILAASTVGAVAFRLQSFY